VKTVKAVLNNTWKSTQYWGGFADGIIDLAPYNTMVTADVKSLVAKKRSAFMKNDYAVFVGPLKDQKGKVRLRAAEDDRCRNALPRLVRSRRCGNDRQIS
jgi:basic membrane protein A